jgi:hypothetical protein
MACRLRCTEGRRNRLNDLGPIFANASAEPRSAARVLTDFRHAGGSEIVRTAFADAAHAVAVYEVTSVPSGTP